MNLIWFHCWFLMLLPLQLRFCSKSPFLCLCSQKFHLFYIPSDCFILVPRSVIHFDFILVVVRYVGLDLIFCMCTASFPSNVYYRGYTSWVSGFCLFVEDHVIECAWGCFCFLCSTALTCTPSVYAVLSLWLCNITWNWRLWFLLLCPCCPGLLLLYGYLLWFVFFFKESLFQLAWCI